MEKLFLLRSRHGDFCSSVSFWNKGGAGYGTDLRNVELFTLEEAQRHLDQDINSLPLLAIEVLKHLVIRVDMQYLNREYGKPENFDDQCVVQINNHFDGNDIKFKDEAFGTYDYDKALVVSYGYAISVARDGETIWLKSFIDSIARPTFQAANINMKTMVRNAGIKYKKPRAPRPTSGKIRGNCPSCGKITWDYNPHEQAYCRDCH